MKDRPAHTLPSFTQYINKVFGFRAASAQLHDARHNPPFSPQSVFLAVFYASLFRLPSLQQLEAELAQPALQHWLGLEQAFSDDVLRYSLCSFDVEGLQQMLVQVNRRLKRNKAFEAGRWRGRIVAALDGIEVLSSYSRCCESCLERRVTTRGDDGQPVEHTQYYHRAVGCQIVSAPVKPILALEWVQPGEGEDTAARRLLAQWPELYGSSFFDILLLDSLYAQAPVLKLAQQIGWDLVITLKQENRELSQNAAALFGSRAPDVCLQQREEGRIREARVWDTAGLPFTADYPQPVRVLRAEEQLTAAHYRKGQRTTETTTQQWVWITTLEPSTFPTREVWQLGHLRWKNENNGWNDLTQHWAFKHGFLHACKHRPKTLSPSGQREPVPNRGLAVVTLIQCLAFTLSSAFTLLHSKIVRRYHTPLIEVARQLHRSLWQMQPPARAPTVPTSRP